MSSIQKLPNIVFLVLDTQRFDRLGCYGYPRGTSPNLDAFAAKATLFENAISPAQWTIPSHAAMFTGEPPSTHLTLQSSDVLPSCFTTLAQHLGAVGYRRTGFCNNPLVGLINNDLPRGFEKFYNYCGTIKSVPPKPTRRTPGPLITSWQQAVQAARDFVAPIQAIFAKSNRIFQVALNPIFVPLWSRFARFKGDNPASARDATRFVQQNLMGSNEQPHFLFINMMEPHFPYSPPESFVERFAARVQDDPRAHSFMRTFNHQAVHWVTPAAKPLTELEASTLSEMYDAEVAYQDHMLGPLYDALDQPECRDNTMVIVVADHGEMLGEHQFVGHGFGVYQELIHVPLLIRMPGQTQGEIHNRPCSTRRLFHTVLDAASISSVETHYGRTVNVRDQSLLNDVGPGGRPLLPIVSEAYTPEFALTATKNHKPGLLETLACDRTRWSILEDTYKLIRTEGMGDQLYDWVQDPTEEHALKLNGSKPRTNDALAGGAIDHDAYAQRLRQHLNAFVEIARQHRPGDAGTQKADLEDELVRERLRGLGYIE
jgi:arylsulfatase A-like enzyme